MPNLSIGIITMDYREYYLNIAKLKVVSENDKEINAHCPFHEDSKKSFSVDKSTGLWNCFGECQEGGNIVQFHSKQFGLSPREAKKEIQGLFKRSLVNKNIPQLIIEEHHKLLLKNNKMMKWLREKRGLTIDTIKQFKLGFARDRIWIPIFENGSYVNVRRYLPECPEGQEKVKSYSEGYGESRIFPFKNLEQKEILICEGEMDCILANQLGYNAITVTAGAGTFKEDFIPLFKNKVVRICYDIDPPGVRGAIKVAKILSPITEKVSIIDLPIEFPYNGDFTDFFITHKKSKKEFDNLIKNAKKFSLFEKKKIVDEKIYDTSLNDSSLNKYYFKRTRMKVVVSGKDLAPFFAPKKIKLSCNMGMRRCMGCGLASEKGNMVIELDPESPELLQLINCSELQQKGIVKQKAKIFNCSVFEMHVEEVYNIEEVRVIPEIDYSPKDIDYTTRNIYSISHGIRTNKGYIMEGITLPDPNTQYATQIISKIKPTEFSFDQFEMNKDVIKKLKIFQSNEDIEKKLEEIHKDLTYNVTKIYERYDLLTGIDLVYHSPIQFNYMKNKVIKGWAELLILGDTRSGKTETLTRIIDHYKAGELVTGENISYAGLVGGMQQVQQRWNISWGKIPLNDRRLIVLDEISSMDPETISNMSGIRSSGIAEITKIQVEKTNARTRLIWLSNPRSGRKLDTYNHGVMAIKELIGRVEDIARFDLAITCASNEVDISKMSQYIKLKVPHKYTGELCHLLINWVWSRKPEEVVFEKDVEEFILECSNILSKKYSSDIPLVEPAEERIKIARLSISLAARLFSTDISGEKIVVKKIHVEYICNFLDKIFSKSSMEYDIYSMSVKKKIELTPEDKEKLFKDFQGFMEWENLRDILLEYQRFRKSELIDQIGYDSDESKRLFKWLGVNRLVKSMSVGYVKSPAFTEFLKSIKEEKDKNERPRF